MFWVKFYMNLSAVSCLETIRQLLESNLAIGKLKLGFLGEKMFSPRVLPVLARHR